MCFTTLVSANKFSKCLERAECTSAVCDNTAVVSQRLSRFTAVVLEDCCAQALY